MSAKETVRIGIASTITGCGPDSFVADGAAVLQYSIQLTSHRGPKGGKYAYDHYILYHPEAKHCAQPLAALGYNLLETPTPVRIEEIREGSILRERIAQNGCCGEKELIKLEVFRLTQHPVVVHFDLDVLVSQPIDAVIDFMLHPSLEVPPGVPIMWPEKEIPKYISLIYTKDYNMVGPKRKDKPYQGGFFMIRPNLDIYDEFVQIVKRADYREGPQGSGWGGIVGPFHGGMTIQGLLPWYFEYLHPGQSVELNRCIYNSMADNPTTEKSVKNTAVGHCLTDQEICEDCRKTNVSQIVTFHYTACFKPWMCAPQKQNRVEMRLCHQMHHEWFRYRQELEKSIWGRLGKGPYDFMEDHFLGYCKFAGYHGYHPLEAPYQRIDVG